MARSARRKPDIAGLDDFQGDLFHSARWKHDVDLRGKRIAVIGTGASAIQIIPQMPKIASRLTVFQRTPAWIIPRADRPLRVIEQAVFKRVPALQTLYRDAIYWRNELYATGFVVDPRLMKAGEFAANLFRTQGEGPHPARQADARLHHGLQAHAAVQRVLRATPFKVFAKGIAYASDFL